MRLLTLPASLTPILFLAIPLNASGQKAQETGVAESYVVEQVVSDLKATSHRYRKLLDRQSMSAGVYILPSGATDSQRPHDRDEIYYVISGTGKLVVESDTLAAVPGVALFVAANADHQFIEIGDALELLVVFGGKD
ncbi:MAG: cupin domain-containing protein [Rhodothermia bacterium]|nr:cupin domain-containing protein [Rhodothermia bacterium]